MRDNINYNINWEIHSNKIVNVLTGNLFDKNGYDYYGFNDQGKYYDGTDYDKNGNVRDFYNNEVRNIVGTDILKYGFNLKKCDELGFDIFSKDKSGKYKEELILNDLITENKSVDNIIKIKANEERIKVLDLIVSARKLANEEISIEDYCMNHSLNIMGLIDCLNELNIESSVVNKLYKYEVRYKECKTEFNKDRYLKNTSIFINGEYIKPSESDVDNCINYLKSNNSLIYDKKVRLTVSDYLKGDIDISTKECVCEIIQEPEDINITEEDIRIKNEVIEEEKIKCLAEKGTTGSSCDGSSFRMCSNSSRHSFNKKNLPALYNKSGFVNKVVSFFKKIFARRKYNNENC